MTPENGLLEWLNLMEHCKGGRPAQNPNKSCPQLLMSLVSRFGSEKGSAGSPAVDLFALNSGSRQPAGGSMGLE